MDDLFYFSTESANHSEGEDFKTDLEKTDPNKSNGAAGSHKAADGQERVKVPPLTADKSRSVRPRRTVQEEGATDLCLLPMEEGSCQRYTLRWYFNSQVRACRPFIYSGCKGNDNRFLHLEECEEACLGETKKLQTLQTAR
ncbi:uncharacterized protein V3H82_005953 [Fundulus diaphanus]